MRLFKQTSLVALLCALVLGLTSAKIISVEKKNESPVVTEQKSTTAVSPTLSYKELKEMATNLKGEKLTLKEKIALKVFKKKIGTAMESNGSAEKSQLVALLLCGFLGGIGVHRFYLGYTWQGIVQLLTLGGCGIWSLIDFIRILTGSLKPKDGEYDKTL
jgi:TM2 domain-containing membrane protein YozV